MREREREREREDDGGKTSSYSCCVWTKAWTAAAAEARVVHSVPNPIWAWRRKVRFEKARLQ
jgi:hypothetical protein